MPRMSKQARIEELERILATEQAGIRDIIKEKEFLLKKIDDKVKRVSEIAAENESLRMDKKWLQQVHLAALQSMHEYQKGRN